MDYGSGTKMSEEDPGGQPQGFHPENVMTIALDPRCKALYGVPNAEHDGVWRRREADIALAWGRQ